MSGPERPDRVGVPEGDPAAGVLRLGAVVSIVQGALLVAIGVAGLLLGVDALVDDGVAGLAGGQLDVIAPIDWGVMLELVFVGAWVWIIAAARRGPPPFPAGFVWFGLATVAFCAGPVWHAWIPRLFAHRLQERRDVR